MDKAISLMDVDSTTLQPRNFLCFFLRMNHEKDSQKQLCVEDASFKGWPKAYLSEAEARKIERDLQLEEDLAAARQQLLTTVSDTKPYLDLANMVAIHGLLWALVLRVLSSIGQHGVTERSAMGLFVLGFLLIQLWPRLTRACDAIADIAILRVSKRLRMPFPLRGHRSATAAWAAASVRVVLSFGVIIGSGFIGHELAEKAFPSEKKTDEARPKPASREGLATGSIDRPGETKPGEIMSKAPWAKK